MITKFEQPIIILGMHRSGTSMLTRELEKAGIFLGQDLDRNHESKFFMNINEKLIKESGGRWDNPSAINFLLNDPELVELYKLFIRDELNKFKMRGYYGFKNSFTCPEKKYWGWKDPRNTYTLPIWREIFPKAKVICIERHGLDVALSLMTRRNEYLKYNKHKYKKFNFIHKIISKRGTFVDTIRCQNLLSSLQLWSEYSLKARSFDNCIHVKYEDFVVQPQVTLKRIFEYIELDYKVTNDFKHIDATKAFSYKKRISISENESEKYNKYLNELEYRV